VPDFGYPMGIAIDLSFAGRLQLVAPVGSTGSGCSLLPNGHIDAADVVPSNPLVAGALGGCLCGGGSGHM
jgi:hypothetical protein